MTSTPRPARSSASISTTTDKEQERSSGQEKNCPLFLCLRPDHKKRKEQVYEIKFYQGHMEYEYDVDAENGNILKFDKDFD